MKKIFHKLIVIALIIGSLAIYTCCFSIGTIGNGNLVTSERTVSAFEKISCSGNAEVRFHVGEEYRVVVTVDENLDEYVEISTKNNVLNIGIKKGYKCLFTKFLVNVYCPVLTDVSLTGSGKIEGVIECDNFSAIITGSGRITVSGTSKNTSIKITGSGNFSGKEFTINNATVKITGSGQANVCVEDNLNAHITGSGEINYYGEPKKVDSKVSGSGRIRKL